MKQSKKVCFVEQGIQGKKKEGRREVENTRNRADGQAVEGTGGRGRGKVLRKKEPRFLEKTLRDITRRPGIFGQSEESDSICLGVK